VGKAHAIAGFWIGFGAIVHALVFGILADLVGVASTLAVVGGLHSLILGAAWYWGFRRLGFYGTEGGDSDSEDNSEDSDHGEGLGTPAMALLRTWKMMGVLFVFSAFMVSASSSKAVLHW
jgi:hypothetical protein